MNGVGRLTVAAAMVIAPACGGSTRSSSDAPGGDAGISEASTTEAAAEDGDTDAETADDGPWPAAHYPMPLFSDLGGTVLSAPQVVTVTFAGNPNRDAFRAFDDYLTAGSPWWTAVSAGYAISAGSGGVYAELPDTVSNTTLDDTTQLQPMIAAWIAAGTLPTPDANTLYVLYFPSTTTITLTGNGSSCSSFGGYHNSVSIPLEAGFIEAAYAVIPDCPEPAADGGVSDESLAEYTYDVSHETIEAATDPHVQVAPTWYGFNDAWFRIPGTTGGQGEVADVCQRFGPFTDPSGHALARSWVNAAATASHDPCQPELPGEIFYSVAVPTTKVYSTASGGSYESDGYVVMKLGETKTLDSVVFSEAKLPNDVTIAVGGRSHGTLNPAIATGITASITPTSGHNGMHAELTVSIAATATAGDYPAIVRATLNANDHHDWPIIIRVEAAAQ